MYEYLRLAKEWFIYIVVALLVIVVIVLWLNDPSPKKFVGARPLYDPMCSCRLEDSPVGYYKGKSTREDRGGTFRNHRSYRSSSRDYSSYDSHPVTHYEYEDRTPKLLPGISQAIINIPANPSPAQLKTIYTEHQSKGESECARVLQKMFNRPFPNVRLPEMINPDTGRRLELDCYNKDVGEMLGYNGLALEYHGEQHFKFPNYFHRTKDQFDKQRRRDEIKLGLCDELGIYLITVPYTVSLSEIAKYIEYYLPHNYKRRLESDLTQ